MNSPLRTLSLALALTGFGATPALAADTFVVDNAHTAVLFFAGHLGFSTTVGSIRKISGEFILDATDASKSSIKLDLDVSSLDTNEAKRDEHLRGPDFFNVKQFPKATFASKTVVQGKDRTFEVTGDLTIHGVSKVVTIKVKQNARGQDPWGGTRSGFDGELMINRSDFGISGMTGGITNEVKLWLSVEGLLKK